AGGDDTFNNWGTVPAVAYGEAGNDHLRGGRTYDLLDGGEGDDTLVLRSTQGFLRGGVGNDTHQRDHAPGSVTVVEFTGAGTDTLDFSPTPDNVYPSTLGVTVNLGTFGTRTVNSNLQLVLAGSPQAVENVRGGYGNDVLIGSSLNNELTGGP